MNFSLILNIFLGFFFIFLTKKKALFLIDWSLEMLNVFFPQLEYAIAAALIMIDMWGKESLNSRLKFNIFHIFVILYQFDIIH